MRLGKLTGIAGFTLVEASVITGIGLFVAAQTAVFLDAAAEKRNRAQCMNNLSQIARGLESYCSDYGGYFPCKPAYGVAPMSFGAKNVAIRESLGAYRDSVNNDVVFTNQLPYAKPGSADNIGVDDEMCIAFGANRDEARRRPAAADQSLQAGPVGLGFLLTSGYLPDAQSYYCPSWNLPADAFKNSCGPDMYLDAEIMGTGQVNTVHAAAAFQTPGMLPLTRGNYRAAGMLRAGDEQLAWYVKNAAVGAQSSYVYRNQAVRLPPEIADQKEIPVPYARPGIKTSTGCPSFKTQKLLSGRAVVADSFLRSYSDVRSKRPGYAQYHHKEGYNVLFGDWSVRWYADPGEKIMWMEQGPKADGSAVTAADDQAPFDAISAVCGTLAGTAADATPSAKTQISGRAAVYHMFDLSNGMDARGQDLPPPVAPKGDLRF